MTILCRDNYLGNILTIDNLNPAAYTFTYTVTATAPCTTNGTSQVTITINDTAAATIVNATPKFCLVDGPTVADLAPFISGTSITWYAGQDDTTPLNATDSLEDGEDYFAVQNDTATGCESAVRVSLTVTVGDAPTPTLIDTDQELCINDAPIINDLTLNVTEFDAASNNVVSV
ncbi:hypothetical protein N7U66_10135 [Lacinutrix neustonica]|uniref:Ig-like domain-containing protein n=1 Tax=Lacinutrix neustonica TaxID=2980107 RepID=A0A9E8MZI4_9FLAO|nr:hypothetical protein [Lacinutrix neustonica]WAC03745.1 hypothetical protein N7U66_10135 [Lacinutrix neustonica]